MEIFEAICSLKRSLRCLNFSCTTSRSIQLQFTTNININIYFNISATGTWVLRLSRPLGSVAEILSVTLIQMNALKHYVCLINCMRWFWPMGYRMKFFKITFKIKKGTEKSYKLYNSSFSKTLKEAQVSSKSLRKLLIFCHGWSVCKFCLNRDTSLSLGRTLNPWSP